MAEYGLTERGIVLPTYADLDQTIRERAEQAFRVVLGQNTSWTLTWDNTNPVTVFYRVLESEIFALWRIAEHTYWSGSPVTATGDALDLLVAEHGITRRSARAAVGIVGVQSAAGRILRAGTEFVASNGEVFRLARDVQTKEGRAVDAWVVAAEPGRRGNVGPGAITVVRDASGDVTVDSTFHRATLSTGAIWNTMLPVPPGASGAYYQVIRGADIEHPLRVTEVRFWVRNDAGTFGDKRYRLEVALIDDTSGRVLYRTGEQTVVIPRGEAREVRWSGLNWDVGEYTGRLRLAVYTAPNSEEGLVVLGNTYNPYPGCYWYADGAEQTGTAALFTIVSERPGGTWGGEDAESDAALRIRFFNTKARGGAGHPEAIASAVWAIPGVRACRVYQNRTNDVSGGLPPHSVRVVVDGGTLADIGKALLRSVPAGIQLVGSQAVEVEDAYGQRHIVQFDRPTPVRVMARVRIRRAVDFKPDTIQAVRDAVVRTVGGTDAAGQTHNQDIGEEVSYARVTAAVLAVPGVADIDSLELSTDGETWVRDNVTIGGDEIATCALEDVEVMWV